MNRRAAQALLFAFSFASIAAGVGCSSHTKRMPEGPPPEYEPPPARSAQPAAPAASSSARQNAAP